jgi:hypothetical protein
LPLATICHLPQGQMTGLVWRTLDQVVIVFERLEQTVPCPGLCHLTKQKKCKTCIVLHLREWKWDYIRKTTFEFLHLIAAFHILLQK